MQDIYLKKYIEKARGCSLCRLRQGATNVVPGDGNLKSRILLVGEGPGKNEDLQGVPFCGASGRFLDNLLGSIGVDRKDVFITNVVRCRPPENRDPMQDEIKLCTKWTKIIIRSMNPDIIVTLGRFSMNYFLGDVKISNVHGKVIWHDFRVIMPMYHPAVALYNGSMRQKLLDDFYNVKKYLDGDISPSPFKEEDEFSFKRRFSLVKK